MALVIDIGLMIVPLEEARVSVAGWRRVANRGIETRYILRDENPELIDRFLTNGTRSIPKLIAIDRNSGGILGTWGPRPKAAQNLFAEQKSLGMDKPVIHENIQRWYLADRGRSLQLEIAELVKGWLRTPLANAA